MRYGLSVRQMSRNVTVEDLVAVAELAERLQFDPCGRGTM